MASDVSTWDGVGGDADIHVSSVSSKTGVIVVSFGGVTPVDRDFMQQFIWCGHQTFPN